MNMDFLQGSFSQAPENCSFECAHQEEPASVSLSMRGQNPDFPNCRLTDRTELVSAMPTSPLPSFSSRTLSFCSFLSRMPAVTVVQMKMELTFSPAPSTYWRSNHLSSLKLMPSAVRVWHCVVLLPLVFHPHWCQARPAVWDGALCSYWTFSLIFSSE